MAKHNSFYVLYPKDIVVSNYLNAMKVLCDPTQRTYAHITVRGPYKNKLNTDLLNIQNSIIRNEELIISDVENFFPFNNQNTVFLKCDDNENLKKIWKKLTYNDFKPHITIYDGKNFEYAQKIFAILSKNFKPFTYQVENLTFLEPKSKDALSLFALKNSFDYNFFKRAFNQNINISSITEMSKTERIKHLEVFSEIAFNALSEKHYHQQPVLRQAGRTSPFDTFS